MKKVYIAAKGFLQETMSNEIIKIDGDLIINAKDFLNIVNCSVYVKGNVIIENNGDVENLYVTENLFKIDGDVDMQIIGNATNVHIIDNPPLNPPTNA